MLPQATARTALRVGRLTTSPLATSPTRSMMRGASGAREQTLARTSSTQLSLRMGPLGGQAPQKWSPPPAPTLGSMVSRAQGDDGTGLKNGTELELCHGGVVDDLELQIVNFTTH
ncbi:hypothetical protein BDQ17DRAFT_1331130 [Cyathus striatus]|nr:hypothetical protein BDQ17DRAFT_1331130 [Cyathus striatus]